LPGGVDPRAMQRLGLDGGRTYLRKSQGEKNTAPANGDRGRGDRQRETFGCNYIPLNYSAVALRASFYGI